MSVHLGAVCDRGGALMRLFLLFFAAVLPSGLWALGDIRPQLRPEYEPVVLPDRAADIRPQPRDNTLPYTRWAHLGGTDVWTRVAEAALKDHGASMVATVPGDIDAWCPAYRENGLEDRRAFWVGLISTLAKHESTYRPRVSGDGGLSHGLLQIRSGTARLYGCRARSRSALLDPTENVSCAIRIMSRTVPRDNAVARKASGGRGGPGADWGPFVQRAKREDMRAWVRRQSYCVPLSTVRPQMRPITLASAE
ncbi:MAG: transglycosylase SLT domain-containing protein [Pseudomonadota bacterium]